MSWGCHGSAGRVSSCDTPAFERQVGSTGSNCPLQGRNELFQARAESLAECSKLDHVNSTLTPFALADECLRFPDLHCKLGCRKANSPTGIAQDFEEHRVLS